MTIIKEEIRLEGVPVSEGIAMGTLFFLQPEEEWSIPEFAITSSQVGGEISRYRRAIASSREELEKLQFFLAKEGSKEAVTILDSHIQMLEDPIMTTVMEEKISLMLQNTESVFRIVIQEYQQFFEESNALIASDRLIDLKDLSRRILSHLNPSTEGDSSSIPENSIACGYELVPSFAAEASVNCLEGFISEIGGETSHAALIAKSKGIPYVSSVKTYLLEHVHEQKIILDGNTGLVVISPEEETLEEYASRQEKRKQCMISVEQGDVKPIVTSNGEKISVWANLESLDDLKKIQDYQVEGIGLIRTEFLFLRQKIEELTEEDQFVSYKGILEKAGPIVSTFRVFDFGCDKKFVEYDFFEPNPALGCRSIRYLLRFPRLLRMQFRALLRASIFGKMKIMLPFISDLEELREVKAILAKIKEEMREQGIVFNEDIPLGCMVEVPSFALMADHFAKECDFFSIGTNDLVQYTLAMDRSNPDADHTYHPAHPSILRLIEIVLAAAKKEGIPVSLCGEIAANSLYTPLLVGLGLRTLSCSARYIPYVRSTLGKLDLDEAEEIASSALQMDSFHNVHQLLVAKYSRLEDDL